MNCVICKTDPESYFPAPYAGIQGVATEMFCWDCLVAEGMWCKAHSITKDCVSAFGAACVNCAFDALATTRGEYEIAARIGRSIGASDFENFQGCLEMAAIEARLTDERMLVFLLHVMAQQRSCTFDEAIEITVREGWRMVIPHFMGVLELPKLNPEQHRGLLERSPLWHHISRWEDRLQPGDSDDEPQLILASFGLRQLEVGGSLWSYLVQRNQGERLSEDMLYIAANMMRWFGFHVGRRFIINAWEVARGNGELFRDALLEKWRSRSEYSDLFQILNRDDGQPSLFEVTPPVEETAEKVIRWLATYSGGKYVDTLQAIEEG